MGVPSEDHGGALKGPWGPSQGTTGVPSEDHDLWARCEAVDAMEDTAASSAPGTPYIANAKLRTQVGLVQEVWAHFLPSEDPLKDYDARSLLRGAKGSTQVAHDAVAITADVIKEGRVRTTPVAFAKGTAARIANGDDMPRPVRSATASSTATGTGDGRSTDELAEPNEEQRRRLDRVKNLGALFGED